MKLIDMEIKTVFGENLKFYRKAKHLSQEQLSEKVEISVKHLSSIERGLNFVSADLLEKLAYSVEIPIFYFFVNKRDFFYNDVMLNTIDVIIEDKLVKVIDEIKSEIRHKNNKLPNL
jgi:transcriptional regulator with XRE-family HTH domain